MARRPRSIAYALTVATDHSSRHQARERGPRRGQSLETLRFWQLHHCYLGQHQRRCKLQTVLTKLFPYMNRIGTRFRTKFGARRLVCTRHRSKSTYFLASRSMKKLISLLLAVYSTPCSFSGRHLTPIWCWNTQTRASPFLLTHQLARVCGKC